jgi:hypothetical protein
VIKKLTILALVYFVQREENVYSNGG